MNIWGLNMIWERCSQWCRELWFKLNPVSGILLTVSTDDLDGWRVNKAIDVRTKLWWPSDYPKSLRSLSSNKVIEFAPEVEEYLQSVGAVKMVNTYVGVHLHGGYTDDVALLQARLRFLTDAAPFVQGILFAHPSQVVQFKLRFL